MDRKFVPITFVQVFPASCTLACFEAFLAQNGISIPQCRMKVIRPDLCGDKDDASRCIYTQHYSQIGRAFGFSCSEIVVDFVPYPRYPTSAILMGTDALTGVPHSLLWTYFDAATGIAFAMDPDGRYIRFRESKLNQWRCKLWLLEI